MASQTTFCPLQIVDGEGRPVADAYLWVIPPRRDPYERDGIREYTSDDRGCVDLPLKHPLDVIAYDPFGGQLAPITRLSPGKGTVVLRLRPGATLDVRVINDENDRPLSRGAVLLENQTLYRSLMNRLQTYPTLTPLLPILKRRVPLASNGIAHAEGLFPGEYRIYGAVDGFTVLPDLMYLKPGHRQTESVRAIPGGTTLEITVTDENGHPLQGAHVYLNRFQLENSELLDFLYRLIPRYQVTDAKGRVSFYGIPLNTTFNILVNDLPRGVLVRRNVHLNSSHMSLRITVPRGNTLTGILLDEDHNPVKHVKIPLMITDDFDLYLQLQAGWTPPNASGRFVIRGLPTEKVHIKFESEGYRPVVVTQTFSGSGQKVDVGTLVFKRGALIKGQVVDDLGVPVPDARIGVEPESRPMFSPVDRFKEEQAVHSDASGHFTIGGLESDVSYTLWISAKGHVTTMRRGIRAGEEKLVITLKRAVGLKGRVIRAADDQPVPFFHLQLQIDSPETEYSIDFNETRVFADPEGSFSWDEVPEGEAFFQIRAPELAVFESTVTLKRGEVLDVGTIRLHRGCPVRVRVQTPDGLPAPLTYVNLKVKGRYQLSGITKITGADGTAFLGSYPPGDYVISYTHPDYIPGTHAFTLSESCPENPIEIQLQRGGRLHVCVYDAQHQGIPNVRITVVAQDQQSGQVEITDENGCTTTGQLPPGEVTIYARKFNLSTGKFRRIHKKASVVEGETTNIELSFCEQRIRGHLFLGDEPVPNVSVLLFPQTGRSSAGYETSVTDAWGAFEMCTSPAEKYYVDVQFSERAYTDGLIKMPPPDEATGVIPLEIRLPGNRMTVQVVDAETGEPLSDARVAIEKKEQEEVPNEFLASCETDPGGTCELKGFSSHMDRLSVTRKGYQTVEVDLPNVATLPSPYTVAMERGSTLRGKVQNTHGQPLRANISVRVSGKTRYFWNQPLGMYQLSGLPRNKPFTLVVSAQGYAPWYYTDLTLTEEEEVLDVILEPGVNLVVHVVDKDGKPVPDARVMIFTPDDIYLRSARTNTPSSGVVRLENVPRQPVVVKAMVDKRSGRVMVQTPETQPEVTVVISEPEEKPSP